MIYWKTLSHQFSKDGIKTYIMSGDMDLLQLVDKNTSIVMNKKRGIQLSDL